MFLATNISVASFSITVTLCDHASSQPWTLTTVYGPSDDECKRAFLDEPISIHSQITGPWLVIDDFNLILHDQDKNKPRVNRRWMRRFRDALDRSFLKEIKLIGRRFTWSNEQDDPTLVRLGRAFCNS